MVRRKKNHSKRSGRPPSRRRGRPHYGPLHPWRICPIGEHWVRTHDVRCEPGPQHPYGTYIRHGHCHTNPSHRDHLYRPEMENMAKEFFPPLTGSPAPNNLEFNHGNDFDYVIRGWTKYWNEILQPKLPLDPDLVKALVASESGFNANADTKKKGAGRARGLMQVTDGTRETLRGTDGDLDDHLITLTANDAYNPNLNIAAGVRWLFEKQRLASRQLERDATWMEAAFAYKGILRKLLTKEEKIRFPELRARLRGYYETLKQSEGT
jgi:Transglycosylase SLT domain